MSRKERPHRDIIDDLEKEGRSLEAILLAWSIVEVLSSDALFKAFLRISKRKPEWEWISSMYPDTKLKLLRSMGILSADDFAKIYRFKKKRDQLAHTHGIYYPNYTEKEKADLVALGRVAADVMHDMSARMSQSDGIPLTEDSPRQRYGRRTPNYA